MKIYQSKSFERKIKKLTKNEKKELDEEIRQIVQNPLTGIEKKGDLKGILVHKFKLQKQLYLLSYRVNAEENLELIMIGTHENYYRDLKSYLKKS